MLERVKGANPVNSSSTYSKKSGVSIKNVTDGHQEEVNTKITGSQKADDREANPEDEQVKEAVEKLNSDIRFKRTGCQFTYHEECNRVSIKLYDTETKEVIREIPSADTIKMLEKLNEIAGLMIDERM